MRNTIHKRRLGECTRMRRRRASIQSPGRVEDKDAGGSVVNDLRVRERWWRWCQRAQPREQLRVLCAERDRTRRARRCHLRILVALGSTRLRRLEHWRAALRTLVSNEHQETLHAFHHSSAATRRASRYTCVLLVRPVTQVVRVQ